MSEEKKKGSKSYETFYYIIMTLAVAGFGFFGYMKLTDTEFTFLTVLSVAIPYASRRRLYFLQSAYLHYLKKTERS